MSRRTDSPSAGEPPTPASRIFGLAPPSLFLHGADDLHRVLCDVPLRLWHGVEAGVFRGDAESPLAMTLRADKDRESCPGSP